MLKSGDEEIESMKEEKPKIIVEQSHGQQLPHQQTPHKKANQSEKDPQTKGPGRMNAKVKIIPESRKGQLNTQYLATLPGLLKIMELVLGFVAFILAICARRSTNSAWVEHITFETTIVVSVLVALYVVFPHLTFGDERTRDGLIVVELFFYGINTIFFFIGIWLMVHLSASFTAEGRGAAILGSILCLALCVIYAGEAYIKFKVWANPLGKSQQQKNPKGHNTTPTQHEEKANGRSEMDERAVV